MVAGVLILLSLASYSSADDASGENAFTTLIKIVTNSADPLLRQKIEQTPNWLGIYGAMISYFLIKTTLGYFVLVLPFLMMWWGWITLRKGDMRRLAVFTSYILVMAVLGSLLFGLLRQTALSALFVSSEWCGDIGVFLSDVVGKLIGVTGGIILSLSFLFAVITLAIDLDLHATSERVKDAFLAIAALLAEWNRRRKERSEARTADDARKKKEVIKIKKPDGEISGHRTSEKSTPEPAKEKPEPPKEKPVPPVIKRPDPQLYSAADTPLDIKAVVQEEEVELGEREVADEEIDYVFPSVELLNPQRQSDTPDDAELQANAELLKAKLADFDVEVGSVSVTPGPVVTLYELVPATGVKVSKITSLANDLALAMSARGIRIEAPIPGKGTVGVEIPNHKPSLVTIRSIINSAKFRDAHAALPLAMGKTISGEVCVDDLSKMPHLLIAGSTGSGKSVGINTILMSLIFRLHPSEVKFLIIDPKKIELSLYRKLEHHYLAVSRDVDEKILTSPQNSVLGLKAAELEMEQRYDKLAHAGVRNIADYNERIGSGRLKDSDTFKHRKLPYLVIIIDELADLMITAAREVEEPITRLAQLARAVGIHLVVATQRPSVDVITGVIKANFPARIAYQVASKTDSRTILDMNGAEQLLGNGDMLYLPSGSPKPLRIQNAFISSDEVEAIVDHIAKQKGYSKPFELPSVLENRRSSAKSGGGDLDELFEEAARTIVRHQQGSVSLLQRRLKVGYSRAARLVDELEAAGIVGPFDGSKAREVLVESETELEAILKSL